MGEPGCGAGGLGRKRCVADGYLDSSSSSTGRVLANTKYECGVREKPPTCTSRVLSPTICDASTQGFRCYSTTLDIGPATRVRPAVAERRLKAYPIIKHTKRNRKKNLQVIPSLLSVGLIQGAECQRCTLREKKCSTGRSIVRHSSLGREARKPMRKTQNGRKKGTGGLCSVTE